MTATGVRGESTAAQFVRNEIDRQNRHLHNSAALGVKHVLLEELAEVWRECRQPDWDAYNALPVSRNPQSVIRILHSLFPPALQKSSTTNATNEHE